MKTHAMNSKLNTALIRRSGEEGFTMPVVLGMGLFMLLVGVTMIVRSQGDNITASAQKSTTTALGAAETGLSNYQNFINTYREVAMYPDCTQTRTQSGNNRVCSDTGNTQVSWANAANIKLSSCTSSSSAISSSNQSITWTDVDSTDPTKGQYRLVSYTYGGTPGNSPGTGVLTVEGRVNQIGSGGSATKGPNTATTRLKVNISVQDATVITYPFPGMWVQNSVNTGSTAANVMGPCGLVPQSLGLVSSSYKFVNLNVPMPSVPATPTTNINTITYSGLPVISGVKTLPRAADILNQSNYNSATGEYQYIMTDSINDDLLFTPGYKVAVYLQGNIGMTGGQSAILHNCTGVPGCKATDARIYGTSASGTATFSLGGNASVCDILFLAPTYAVSLSGGGQAQGCGGGANTNGVYWVKSWSGGGQGNHTSLNQTAAGWSDVAFLDIPIPPQISPSVTWEQQEVQ